MLTLSTIRRRIGGAAAARPLALLKVDIEGFEWLEMQQNTSRRATAIGTVLEKEPALAHLMAEISAAPPQFEQLCIELHHGTPRAWQLAIRRMLELGFTLAAVEGARFHNGHQPMAELTFVRADGAASSGRPRGRHAAEVRGTTLCRGARRRARRLRAPCRGCTARSKVSVSFVREKSRVRSAHRGQRHTDHAWHTLTQGWYSSAAQFHQRRGAAEGAARHHRRRHDGAVEGDARRVLEDVVDPPLEAGNVLE